MLFNQHFQGTLDHWDPAVTDGLAATREVILFDNAGVSASSGETPSSFHDMGANAIAFARALGLTQVDVLGFSIGGMVAQEIAVQAPDLVRKLILVGTGPRGADMAASQSADYLRRDLRACRASLAQGPLLALGGEPGCRPRVPGPQVAPP